MKNKIAQISMHRDMHACILWWWLDRLFKYFYQVRS